MKNFKTWPNFNHSQNFSKLVKTIANNLKKLLKTHLLQTNTQLLTTCTSNLQNSQNPSILSMTAVIIVFKLCSIFHHSQNISKWMKTDANNIKTLVKTHSLHTNTPELNENTYLLKSQFPQI